MEHPRIFFDGWDAILRVVVVAVLLYPALVVLLRLTGKRSLAKMNIWDFVFVVALGTMVGTTILSDTSQLLEGLAGIVCLLGVQQILSYLTTHWDAAERIVNGEPTLLVHRGEILPDAVRGQALTIEEVLAAVRSAGLARVEDAYAVVLETDGTFSVMRKPQNDQPPSSLTDVPGADEAPPQEPANWPPGKPPYPVRRPQRPGGWKRKGARGDSAESASAGEESGREGVAGHKSSAASGGGGSTKK